MKITNAIQWKAILLLLVFGLNTVIGFACAVGFTIGSKNHHAESNKPHEHATEEKSKHEHAVKAVHSHGTEATHQHGKTEKKDQKDDCCKDEVVKFQNLDKALQQHFKALFTPVLVAFVSSFLLDINQYTTAHVQKVYRTFYPPPKQIITIIHRYQV